MKELADKLGLVQTFVSRFFSPSVSLFYMSATALNRH